MVPTNLHEFAPILHLTFPFAYIRGLFLHSEQCISPKIVPKLFVSSGRRTLSIDRKEIPLTTTPQLDQLCINTLRFLAVDAVQKAKSGHPGMPMGAAAMAYVLWTRHLRHNPANPRWAGRDRFILSAGHGSMLLYGLLHLTGYDLSLDELKNFRQWRSKTPGHPEYHLTPGVETTTGPLGQGFANGVGMAIAQRALAARYNKPGYPLLDYHVYAIVSDGDLMEGVASEAASLAGHLKLGNLVYLYDDNKISIDGPTSLAFTEEVGRRFTAYGWLVRTVENGNDTDLLHRAIMEARQQSDRPSLIMVRTHIGFGSPNKQDTSEAHGSPLGEDEVKLTKEKLGWDPGKSFVIPDEALAHFRRSVEKGAELESAWNADFEAYRTGFPDLASEFEAAGRGEFGDAWRNALPTFTDPMATREASGKVLTAIAPHLPTLIGGSADLTPSNNTLVKGFGNFQATAPDGRYIRFGVREHAMGSILNGLALTEGIIPYGGTFLIFSEYMRPPIRLAALMGVRPIYVYTHDSIGLGEDGPTHQPVEQLASLRSIPNMTLIRPADANEVVVAWRMAIEHRSGPVALALTRQKVPLIDRVKYAPAAHAERGAYVLGETHPSPDMMIISSGSEVQYAIGAYEELAREQVRVRVVSMPSWEIFERQPKEYRETVFPKTVKKRLAVEAGVPMGWHKYVGDSGEIVGITTFGASAPYERIYKEYGLTTENVLARARAML
ncbi:MAG TPA: transketolase [Bacteroidetes bacterium]|nr:transketolase [Bacteroidota bacterium]